MPRTLPPVGRAGRHPARVPPYLHHMAHRGRRLTVPRFGHNGRQRAHVAALLRAFDAGVWLRRDDFNEGEDGQSAGLEFPKRPLAGGGDDAIAVRLHPILQPHGLVDQSERVLIVVQTGNPKVIKTQVRRELGQFRRRQHQVGWGLAPLLCNRLDARRCATR